jgi:hypothetical protein
MQGDVIYVHFFILKYPDAFKLHGKAIPLHRFRGNPNSRPDPAFLEWHYSQCVKARIRGFSAGIEA